MRGQKSHLDPDVLAEYRAGLITGRRGRRIAAHLDGCAECAAAGDQLAELSALLAALPAPAMPESVAQRLDAALAAEVARRADAERAGADHSRDRKRAPRPARRPTLQLVMMRALVPAAAVVVLAAGGYGLSRIVGVQSTSSSAATGSEAEPAPSAVSSAQPAAAAPASGTSYRAAAGTQKPAFTVTSSGTDFERATLRSQLEIALGALAVEGVVPSPSAPAPSAPTPSAQLQACVQRLITGLHPGTPKLVEHAHFQGEPAIVIVASSGAGYVAWVVAPGWVAPGCSATSAGVLDRTTLPGTLGP
jgi:hypothetical protein